MARFVNVKELPPEMFSASFRTDAERELDKLALRRRYNRPWWKAVRLWDRLTRRHERRSASRST